jgi:hypothetical protein
LFLDAHDTLWQGNPNYRHWTTGPVKTDAQDIIAAVDAAFASQASYSDAQRAVLEASFSVTATPASVRAATAIIEYLDEAIG